MRNPIPKRKPGDELNMGVVCEVLKDGSALLGRKATARERCPIEHTEYKFGKLRAFLSEHQAPILPQFLQ